MSDFKGTPGPWMVRVEEGDEWWFGSGRQAVITDSKRETVSVFAGNTPDELANARLIAAAPDLLVAKKALSDE